MSISVQCSNCQATFRVKKELAGRRGKCPKCEAPIQVPVEAELVETVQAAAGPATSSGRQAAPAPSRKPAAKPAPARRKVDLRAQILAGFRGPIEPVQTSLGYRLSIVLVGFVMVLLPLIYVGIIGLVAWGVFWHATENVGMMGAVRGRAVLWATIVYALPIVTGAILVLFMVKPLLARPADQRRTRSVTRNGEPLLFEFVDRLCDAVGAPCPKRIDVDCQVNASASFRRGVLSMFGNDLVLTIGMPLAAGLRLDQFGGVLAHEFGHFAQGAGMRMSYLIRSISWWFTRVVYERDEWDQRLVDWCEDLDIRLSVFLYVARLCVWLTRKILWLLMAVGHLVSGVMLRQMEFDADRHEARFVGGPTFESTCRRLAELGAAYHGAQSDLEAFYREGRLGDNLPKLVMANIDQIPDSLRATINEHVDTSTTGLFDTHPSDQQRIAAAHRENATAVFASDLPAAALFVHFEALAKNVTWDFYLDALGHQIQPSDLHPVDDLLARQRQELAEYESLERYLQGTFSPLRQLTLPGAYLDAPENAEAAVATIKEGRRALLEQRQPYTSAFREYDDADTNGVLACQAKALLDASFKIQPDDFKIAANSTSSARQASAAAAEHMATMASRLGPLEQATAARLFATLRLLHVPTLVATLENAHLLKDEAAELVRTAGAMNRVFQSVMQARNYQAAFAILINNLEGNEGNQDLIDELNVQLRQLTPLLQQIRESLTQVGYPFDHAKGEMTVAVYLLPELPMEGDIGSIYGGGNELLERFPALYRRVFGRLAAIAEQVETALGLAMLPAAEEPAAEEPAAEQMSAASAEAHET